MGQRVARRDATPAPLLSICIPTHDGRRDLIAYSIDRIREQITDELQGRVEVCVSDNASTDGTEELIADYQRRSGARIVYRRHERDLGSVRNIFAAFGLASGRYCWGLMSDDALAPGALAAVVALLDEHPDVTGISFNYEHLDADMEAAVAVHPDEHKPPLDRGTIVYSDYHLLLADVGVLFTHDMFFHRERWQRIVAEKQERLHETSPTFAYALAQGLAARERPYWLWTPQVLVHNRTYTSSWVVDRTVHDVHREWLRDAARMFRELAGDRTDIYRALLHRWMQQVTPPSQVAGWKLMPGITWRDDLAMLTGLGRPFLPVRAFWTQLLPVLLIPHQLFRSRAGLRARWGVVEQPWHDIRSD